MKGTLLTYDDNDDDNDDGHGESWREPHHKPASCGKKEGGHKTLCVKPWDA